MNISHLGFQFTLSIFAAWRVTHLLAHEDGPADSVVKIRQWLGSSLLGQAMDCFKCLSLWVSAVFALFVTHQLLEYLLIWLAISGAVCLLERMGQDAVVINPISELSKGGNENDVLWSETNGK